MKKIKRRFLFWTWYEEYCDHDWSKWVEYEKLVWTIFLKRTCSKCGLVERMETK